MKIMSILGARPQFIKAAVVSQALSVRNQIQHVLVHTGQHFDVNMSDVFFRQLSIPSPQYHLGVYQLSHGAMTGRMLEKIEEVLMQQKPDAVLVYGDTNSTLAGALAARKLHYTVGHVEAGLRSYNKRMPEEINRLLTDHISDLLFCPTLTAVNNLKKEGIDLCGGKTFLTGDVMYDAILHFLKKEPEPHPFVTEKKLKDYVLCTIHREENTTAEVLERLLEALHKIHAVMPVIIPLHPRTQKVLRQANLSCHLHLTEPTGYFELMSLLQHCRLVITDSGGLQKEAFFLKKICITLREETEWTELVDAGYNLLAGTQPERITTAFDQALQINKSFEEKFYGDGHAGEKIADILTDHIKRHGQ
jgi:UDP-GlcNAc3NAcA epimerase